MDKAHELDQILLNKSIYTVYQPIVSLKNGEVLGYEALMRGPESSSLQSPLELLEIAKDEKRLFELEILSREKAILGAVQMPKNCMLFINIESDIMKDVHYKMGYTKELLKKCGLSEENIVFEITERTAINDYGKYIELIENYKHQGYRIAIDDVGSEYSGLNRIHRTKPQFIKIDMEYIRDIHKDSFKKSLVTALAQFAAAANMKSIAEGIETKEELETIMSLEIDYGQGYYFAKPSKEMVSLGGVKSEIQEIIHHIDRFLVNDIDTYSIGNIAETVEVFHDHQSCKFIKDFLNRGHYEGVAIVNENRKPIGLIMKSFLESTMATQYGYSLYSNRAVKILMDKHPLIVNYDTSLKRVSEIVTLRHSKQVYDNVIVEKNGEYYGVVSIKNLLQQITSIETNYAKHLNPLTLLPGNRIINNMVMKLKESQKTVVFGYFDIDNFKVYNDNYGFENGDRMLQLASKLILKNVNQLFPNESFVGHVGGDDFVFILTDYFERVEEMLTKLLVDFELSIQSFFSIDDIKNNKIIGYSRDQELKIFSLTSASIAVYKGGIYKFSNLEVLSEFVANIKKKAKKIPGNSYVIVDETNLVIKEYTTQTVNYNSQLHTEVTISNG